MYVHCVESFTHIECYSLRLYKEEGSSPVSVITERRDMGLYEMPLSMSLFDFGMVYYYVGVRAVFNMLVSLRGPMCFRCLMFNLSGPCELLFSLGPEWESV